MSILISILTLVYRILFDFFHKKPQLLFVCYGNGQLYRHYDFIKNKNGIIRTHGFLRVRHKEITVVNARLFYYIDEKDIHGCKYCGEEFPPKYNFLRINDNGYFSFGESDRLDFVINLSPNGSEKKFEQSFLMSGNFAKEYGEDFFSYKFCRDHELFFTVFIQFQYQYNGDLYWSDEFPVLIAPFPNCVATKNSAFYIDKNGKELKIERHNNGSFIQLTDFDGEIYGK